jgi:hypothetical protein
VPVAPAHNNFAAMRRPVRMTDPKEGARSFKDYFGNFVKFATIHLDS